MKTEPYTEGLPPVRKGDVVALDFEIFNQQKPLHRPTGRLATLAITTQDGNYLIYDEAEVREIVRRCVKERVVVAMQHSTYDLRYLDKFGADWSKLIIWDVEIGAKILGSGLYSSFALDDLVRRAYGVYLEKGIREEFATLTEMGPQHKAYAARDARYTRQLALDQMKQMDEAERKYYRTVEEPALHAILRLNPIPVDVPYWLELAAEYVAKRDAIKEDLGWNPGSWQQIKDHVFRAHGIRLKDTSADTLEDYAGRALIDRVLEYKAVDKGATTYGESWLKNLEGDWAYPDWTPFGAETGRMSCNHPNMQNVPTRKDHRYRYAFAARPLGNLGRGKWVRIKTDADQQEIRVLAYFSKAKALMQAFKDKVSTHLVTGRAIFNDPTMTKKHPQYRLAKDINLGIGFGLTPQGLMLKDKDLTLEQAEAFVRGYFRLYPENQIYISRQQSMGQRLGYVRTASERRVWMNLYNPQWENNSINAPIQGSAAEITKLALVLAMKGLDEAGLPQVLDMVVHDELDANCPAKIARPVVKVVEKAWIDAAAQIIPSVPFAVETEIGPTWGGERE